MSAEQASAEAPLVTIGISTYNRVDGTFPEALRSALAQTYDHLEVVVSDNASEDGTEAFMAAQRDPRLRYHRHPRNVGAHANFNTCLQLARGTYFLLLHDDDLLESDFVARAMAQLGASRPGVVLGGVRIIDGDGVTRGVVAAPPPDAAGPGLFEAWFDRRCSFYFCSTLFHTASLRDVGGFDTPEGLFQDVVAIAELVGRGGYVSVPGVAGAFRRHDGNRGGSSHALRWVRDAEFLLERLQALFPEEAERLTQRGRVYLAAKCYRYVAGERSLAHRWRLYRAIHERFGRSLPPWRHFTDEWWREKRRRWMRVRRRFAGRRGPSPAA